MRSFWLFEEIIGSYIKVKDGNVSSTVDYFETEIGWFFSKTGYIFEYQNKNSTGGLGCILFKRSKKSRVFIKLFIRKWLEHRIVSIAIFWIYKWRILLSIVMNYLCMYNDLYFIQIGIIPEFGGLVGNYSAYCGLFLRIKLKIVKSS